MVPLKMWLWLLRSVELMHCGLLLDEWKLRCLLWDGKWSRGCWGLSESTGWRLVTWA